MKPSILIAETEEAIRESLQLVLEEEGYTIHIASSANELLDVAGTLSFDIIIADASMLNNDPRQLFFRLNLSPVIPQVLALTSYDNVRDVLELMPFGVMDYLIKPFEFEELITRLTSMQQTA